ncbi:hypothetical protein CEP51_012060 [Fusarium floridanum]|uniref:Uncharacterized protein n=1 Tax=Fusarium floridanum TaxID=1325733 RepID=A0A428R1U8_9HYPO|nr:hypothetical protein CEP51_012060 [Fusarium floridanum]
MSGASPSGSGQGPGGPPKAAAPKRVKRMKYDSSGRIVEYWVDVEEKKPEPVKKAPPPVELAKKFEFEDDISIGTLFPSLKDGPFDALNLSKTRMIWLAKDATPTMTAGLWFESDVQFRGILQPISDILRDVFAQEKPGLHLSAHLGIADKWSDELIATGFTFRGSIEGINRGFGEFLTFRNAGIQLHVSPGSKDDSDLSSVYGFFGTLHLHVPNSVTPLVLNYTLEPKEETLDITMRFGSGEKWASVFGVKGLDLDEVTFVTTLVKSDVKKRLEFSINAKWSLGDIPLELSGHIKKNGSSLRAYIKSLTMDDLRKLFNTLTGSQLEPVEQDIRLNDLTLEISEGRIVFYGQIWVDGHQVAKAEVLVTVDGIRISGAVDDLHIGEDVHIQEAQIELIVGDVQKPKIDGKGKGKNTAQDTFASTKPPEKSQKKGTPVAAVIRGVVDVKTDNVQLKFQVAAVISKPAKGPTSYFVYGQLDCKDFSIGKILGSDMEDGHPMDLQLSSLTLVAASHNNVNSQGLNASRFPVSQGIFLCAELKVLLPENIRIELSPNVVSGPLVLLVDTKPLKVMFSAELWVTPDGQEEPLQLTLALSADELQAVAFAQMEGWWDNPLDLSPRLKIGPCLTLEVELNYKQFAATGMPSGVGFEGGFVVDGIDEYHLAFNLGTNPKETLVTLQISKMDEGKIINLINAVALVNIKRPEREMIRFEDVNIYASPLGCLLGKKTYPPGFAIQGKAFILDKKVEIDCQIGSQGLKLKGDIEGFNLGPLTVRGGKRIDGTRSEHAVVDLEITKERQHFEVNGSIELWDLETSVFVLAEAMPNPQLEFNFELQWSDLLKFQVDGRLVKPPGDEKALANLDDADFELHAVMEQQILRKISTAMQDWFKSAQVSVHEGIDAAKKKVDEAKAEFERKCAAAQEKVRAAQAEFEADMKAAQMSLRDKEEECQRKRLENERWVIEEEKRADEEIRSANAALDARNKDFQDDLDSKKRDLTEKQRQGDEAIGGAIRDLQDKRIDLQRSFGSALDAIESARSRVRDAQWSVERASDELNRVKSDYDDCAWYEEVWMWCRVTAKQAELWVLKCALQAAQLILDGAEWVVKSVAYNIAKAAVDMAEGVLSGARSLWDGMIATAKAALDGVGAVHKGIIEAAKLAVMVANETALKIKQGAAAVKDGLLATEAAILAAAHDVVAAVGKGVSFMAFQTALAALEFAKNDTTWVKIAQGALDAAEAVAQAALAAAAWLAQRLCDTLNIEKVELRSSLRKLARGGEFTIRVVGVILGEPFDFSATWSPKDMLSFIIAMCQKLWDDFIHSADRLFKESQF